MPRLLPNYLDMTRVMYFVDGENLAIRLGAILREGGRALSPRAKLEQNVYVWSRDLNEDRHGVVRKYYYTSAHGDRDRLHDLESGLKSLGIEAPRVFPKSKSKGSKRVDISLSTDMLLHATRRHYDIAVLVAGDEDYVPLVRAVQSEGARVIVWFVSSGMSPALQHTADEFLDITWILTESS